MRTHYSHNQAQWQKSKPNMRIHNSKNQRIHNSHNQNNYWDPNSMAKMAKLKSKNGKIK